MSSDYIALPRTTGAPSTQTFTGLGGGMNVAEPSYMIGDNEARYLQDILLDQPGYIRRRGPITDIEGFYINPSMCAGFATTYDPAGTLKLLEYAHVPANFKYLAYPFTSILGQDSGVLTGVGNFPAFDSKASLLTGAWIGASASLNGTPLYWRGGAGTAYATGTMSVARGGTAVTGVGTGWVAGNVSPGTFLFATTDTYPAYVYTFIGVVATVNSATSLTLEKGSPYPVTARGYRLQSTRGPQMRVVTGEITTTTTSAIVTGANTKFKRQLDAHGMTAGASFDVYRMRDDTWIGSVSSVTNDTSLTLAANAAIAMNNEAYYMINARPSLSLIQFPGYLNAVYAQRQWFANNPIVGSSGFAHPNRVWFSETTGPEDLDMSLDDGNWLDISGSGQAQAPILGIAPAYNALLVLKENEALGIFGDTPDTFSVQKIADDGVLSPGSIQTYQGGVLWAGRNGIYSYDGVQTKNIVGDTLGKWYKQLVGPFDPTQRNMYGGIARDHYFLFIEQGASSIPITKGAVSTTPTYITLVINLNTMAVTTFSNFAFRGAIQTPALTGLETLFLINTDTFTGKIVSSKHIFDDTGNDIVLCDSQSLAGLGLGPDFYLETKKHDGGDSLLLKLWTNLVIDYKCAGAALNVDTVVGLNDVGNTINTNLPIQTTFGAKRARFLTRSQHFAFRIWQASTSVTSVTIGPYQLGFRNMRPGRI